jgi:hypothetical protein
LVVGPNANSMRVLDGGWSYSHQGDAIPKYTQQYDTILKAIQNVHGKSNVTYTHRVFLIEKVGIIGKKKKMKLFKLLLSRKKQIIFF